jgi:hypothetical protein
LERANKSHVQHDMLSNPRNNNARLQLVLINDLLLFNEILNLKFFYKNNIKTSKNIDQRHQDEK